VVTAASDREDAVSYVSLYRKYRPQTFAEVIGQDHVTTTLAAAVVEGRPHHAYLFTGPRGTGKTSTARILAKSLNCEAGPTATPDNTCPQCVAVTNGSSVDVLEIDAASHGGVDDVRELRERVTFAPIAARTKVYIVDECHMLSTAGWNAFLKTVEEPPGHVVFIFATTEPHKVPPTILSRTQRFDFRRLPADVLAGQCNQLGQLEGLEFEAGAVDLIVRAGDGSSRDTLSVLDQVTAFTGAHVTLAGVAEVLGSVPDELLVETADAIADGDVPRLCLLVGRLADAGIDLRQYAKDAVEHLRSLFLLQVAPDSALVETTPERLARLSAQAGRLGRVELLRAIELLAEAQAAMRRGNTRLPLEIALVKAALPEAAGDPAALAARLDRLELRIGLESAVSPSTPASTPTATPTPAPDPTDTPAPRISEAPPPSRPPAPVGRPAAQVTAIPADSPSPPVAVDLGLVQASWTAVLDALKVRKRTLAAQLTEGSAVALDGGVLTVSFRAGYGFHAGEVVREEFAPLFAEVFTTLFGVPLRLRSVVHEPADSAAGNSTEERRYVEQAADVAEAEAAEQAGDVPDAEVAHDQAVETLQRTLGATVLEEVRPTS